MKIEIQNTKIELIQWLTTRTGTGPNGEDPVLIQKIMAIRKKESKDWWNEISDEEKKSIEKGLSDADNGRLRSHLEAERIYGKYSPFIPTDKV